MKSIFFGISVISCATALALAVASIATSTSASGRPVTAATNGEQSCIWLDTAMTCNP